MLVRRALTPELATQRELPARLVDPIHSDVARAMRRHLVETIRLYTPVMVPVTNDQCFMSLDVSLSHYGEQPSAPPMITARKQASEPFELPGGNYLREDDLPGSRKQSERALLFRSALCAEIDALESGIAARP